MPDFEHAAQLFVRVNYSYSFLAVFNTSTVGILTRHRV